MAQGSYTTDLTTLTQNETNTGMAEPTAVGWTFLNVVTSAETDYFIQNVACTSATIKVGIGALLYNNGAGFTIPTDGAVFCWAYFWAPGVLAVESSGGARQVIGSSLADFYYVNHLGSDSWLYGGWQCFAMADPGAITTDTQVGTPTATRQYTGWAYNAPTAVPGKGNPYGIDAIRYGRGTLQITDGDATEYGTFAAAAEFNDKNSTAARTGFTLLDSGYHRLGLFQYQDGSYKWQGHFLMGIAATAVDFRDSNRLIFVLNTKHVTANFNLFEVRNATSRVDWTGISIVALGTVSRGRFLATDNADINLDTCTFTDMDTFNFLAATSALNCVFRRTNAVTAPGSNLTGSTFDSPTVAADASAVIWNVATDPTGLLDNTTFIKGTNAHHAIEFGTSSPLSMTISGVTFTGFTNTVGSSAAPLYIKRTSGTVNITATGCTGITADGYKSDGAAVVITTSSRTVKVTVLSASGAAVTESNVFLRAASGGPFPYQVSVSISNSGTTATVTHTSHGLADNDQVIIKGADYALNNGVFTIDVTGASTYTYTMGSPPGDGSAGAGTTSTFVFLKGLANGGAGSNEISMSRSIPSTQPVAGWARKSTSSPRYKTGSIAGNVSATADTSFTAVMILDE